MKSYEFLDHTADVKFRAYGNSLDEAFRSSAKAVSSVIAHGGKIAKKIKKQIEVNGKDREELLYRFLDELLYLLDAEEFVVSDATVSIIGTTLKATLLGDATKNYDDLDHVKAATYAEMHILEKNGTWEIQAVLDV